MYKNHDRAHFNQHSCVYVYEDKKKALQRVKFYFFTLCYFGVDRFIISSLSDMAK